jgi:hypothetical protein
MSKDFYLFIMTYVCMPCHNYKLTCLRVDRSQGGFQDREAGIVVAGGGRGQPAAAGGQGHLQARPHVRADAARRRHGPCVDRHGYDTLTYIRP